MAVSSVSKSCVTDALLLPPLRHDPEAWRAEHSAFACRRVRKLPDGHHEAETDGRQMLDVAGPRKFVSLRRWGRNPDPSPPSRRTIRSSYRATAAPGVAAVAPS